MLVYQMAFILDQLDLQKGQLQLLVDGDLFKVTLVFPGAKME